MHIEKIIIENFKAIANIEIEFQPGINLLIGDNGVGKTSILEAISVAFGGFLSGVSGVSSKNILQEDIRICLNRLGSASSGIEYMTPVRIQCVAEIDGKQYKWKQERKDETGNSKTKLDNRDISKYAQNITNNIKAVLPLFSFQSEARVWQKKRGDFGTALKKKLNDRRCGYIGCLDYSLDVKGIKAWCLKMELASFQQNRKIEEYESFKLIVSSVMQKMNELDEAPKIYYSQQMEDIVYREKEQDMPISYMSAGYQSLLWMSMDLAYRLALLNPEAGKNIFCLPGIVLIDELDMHLHPKWQWNVVKALEETLPNIQFIIATHSPIVISSCKNENLILIRNNQEISYLPNAYGYSIKDVLELRQGSTEKPKEVESLVNKLEEKLNREDYLGAEEVIKQMKKRLGENHSEVKRAQEEFEQSCWIMENK